jgi:hypothetical protein
MRPDVAKVWPDIGASATHAMAGEATVGKNDVASLRGFASTKRRSLFSCYGFLFDKGLISAKVGTEINDHLFDI